MINVELLYRLLAKAYTIAKRGGATDVHVPLGKALEAIPGLMAMERERVEGVRSKKRLRDEDEEYERRRREISEILGIKPKKKTKAQEVIGYALAELGCKVEELSQALEYLGEGGEDVELFTMVFHVEGDYPVRMKVLSWAKYIGWEFSHLRQQNGEYHFSPGDEALAIYQDMLEDEIIYELQIDYRE